MSEYRETLRPPLSLFLFLIFMALSFGFAIWAAFDLAAAFEVTAVLLLSLAFFWPRYAMRIIVSDQLYVDKAHIEFKYLGEVKAVDEAEYKLLRTTQSDARAFHATKPWLKRGVQVFINDDRDPTTYWLIGCKNNKELSAFLTNC